MRLPHHNDAHGNRSQNATESQHQAHTAAGAGSLAAATRAAFPSTSTAPPGRISVDNPAGQETHRVRLFHAELDLLYVCVWPTGTTAGRDRVGVRRARHAGDENDLTFAATVGDIQASA